MEKKKTETNEEIESRIKEQIEKQNRLLKKIFIGFGIFLVILLSVYLIISSARNFEYRGVDFEIEKYCDSKPCLILYKTSIPIQYEDGITGKVIDGDYNIWIRNNPKNLEDVVVEGDINFRKNMVVSVNTENLFCEGDWNIALGNLQKLDVLGINFMPKNESEIFLYVPAENFMYLNIKEGNTTSIVKTSGNSYDMFVSNCEILKATERLMLEAFVQANGGE
ncbi:MAG: hypothetical protein EHM87_24050 [Burkholderiales bacterium]|nr:MAG: hypothetical protein EHM87_24050 [Burkholderiales bacterium]